MQTTDKEVLKLVKEAHDRLTAAKGKEYAPTMREIETEIKRIHPNF